MSAFGNSPLVLGGNALSVASGTSPVGTAGIAATQVAYGDTVANTIKGEAAFVYVEASDRLQIGTATGTRLLLGTGTDSSNGAIQLATHTTSAGGIGFGTDTQIYRSAAANLNFDSALNTALNLSVSGVSKTLLVTNGTTTFLGSASDLVLRTNGVTGTTALTLDSSQFLLKSTGSNGQSLNIKHLTELTTIAAAATTDTTIQMPANAIVLSVSVRVTVVIPTATNFTVGDSGSAARFSTAAVSSAANSTNPGTKAGAYYNASALSVRITPDVQPADNTGRVRVTIAYLDVTPPTS